MVEQKYVLNGTELNTLQQQNYQIRVQLMKLLEMGNEKSNKSVLENVLRICDGQDKILSGVQKLEVAPTVRKDVVANGLELINHDYMIRNFGTNYKDNVFYYDYEQQRWSSRTYCGYAFGEYELDEYGQRLEYFGAQFKNDMAFSANYDLVAVVLRGWHIPFEIEQKVYVGVVRTEPWFAYDANGYVGTLILRDKKSKRLKDIPKEWVVMYCGSGGFSSNVCSCYFMNNKIQDEFMYQAMLRVHTR